MFYDKFKELCDDREISVTKALNEIGLSRALGTKWKKTGATPNGKTLAAIAEYFDVPIDYFWYGTPAGAALLAMKSLPGHVDPMEDLLRNGDVFEVDDFTYAAHKYSGDLRPEDKDTIIKMMQTLATANKGDDKHGKTD